MPRFYLKALRPTLAARVEEAVAAMPAVEQLDVSEELTMIRLTAEDAVEKYAEACELADPAKAGEAKLIVGELMADRMHSVISACDTAAKISEVKLRVQGAFVDVMGSVITSVLHAAYEAFGDDHRIADFEKLLRDHLEMRSVPGYDGTTLTPDQDVIEMDASVPREDSDA